MSEAVQVLQLRYTRYQSGVSPQVQAGWERDVAWIDWAVKLMRGDERVGGSDHLWLLGRYVHDSLAGFCLLGQNSREEKSEKLLELVEKNARGEKLNPYEAKVVKNYEEKSRANAALKEAIQTRVDRNKRAKSASYPTMQSQKFSSDECSRLNIFQPEESRVIDESGVFPVLSDKDAPDLYEGWHEKLALQMLTRGRREGGGYFLPRMVFE